MSGPLVSVIIPTRNRHDCLRHALRSVLDQSFTDFDVWLVDDASTPPVRLGEEIRDGRLHLLRFDRQHWDAARNSAIRACTGRLVAFLDDDDRWRPQYLERMVAAINAAPDDVGLVHAGWELWDGDRVVERRIPDPARDLQVTLLEDLSLAPSTVLVRRAVLADIGGFEPLSRGGDSLLFLDILDRYRALAVPKVLADRRFTHHEPRALLAEYQQFVEALRPRVAALPKAQRRRVEAAHGLTIGVLTARAGLRREARTELWKAWRGHPRRLGPLVHIGRTVLGERSWQAAGRLRRRLFGPPRV